MNPPPETTLPLHRSIIQLIVAAIFFCVVYAASRRSLVELLGLTWPAAVISLVLLFPVLFKDFDRETARMPFHRACKRGVFLLVKALAFAAMLTLAWASVLQAALDFISWPIHIQRSIRESHPSPQSAVALAVWLMSAGILSLFLFKWRRHWRSTYGVVEAGAGLVIVWIQVSKAEENATDFALYMTILTSGVFLIVRGLDNIHQGIKDTEDKQPCDYLAQALFEWGTKEHPMSRHEKILGAIVRFFFRLKTPPSVSQQPDQSK